MLQPHSVFKCNYLLRVINTTITKKNTNATTPGSLCHKTSSRLVFSTTHLFLSFFFLFFFSHLTAQDVLVWFAVKHYVHWDFSQVKRNQTKGQCFKFTNSRPEQKKYGLKALYDNICSYLKLKWPSLFILYFPPTLLFPLTPSLLTLFQHSLPFLFHSCSLSPFLISRNVHTAAKYRAAKLLFIVFLKH